jgi:O-acetyl-ADP-ribose deacetylase (regulator of RNase III)
MIAAPTMRVPMRLVDSVNPYLAARAALLLVKHQQGAQEIRSIAFPGLGTGVGGVGSNTCARQVRAAMEDVLLGARSYPQTWAEASARHQALYTDLPQRLQH